METTQEEKGKNRDHKMESKGKNRDHKMESKNLQMEDTDGDYTGEDGDYK